MSIRVPCLIYKFAIPELALKMVVRHHVREHARRTRSRRSTRVRDHWRGSGSRAVASGSEYHGSKSLFGDHGSGASTELTSAQRTELHNRFPGAFAFPEEGAYPVPTVHELEEVGAARPAASGPRHALNALQRVDAHGTPHQKSVVRDLVNMRYPAVYAEWSQSRR